MKRILIAALASGIPFAGLEAAVIVSGSASFTLKEGMANSISEFDALFDATRTRAQTLSDAAPGNASFAEDATSVRFADPIRPYGESGASGTGRSPQLTNLDFDTSDILGTWGASTDSFGSFVNLGSGEQIALTSMQRWTGPFTGSLLYGDFALRYVPTRAGTIVSGGTLSGLVLTSNIDFLNSSWADLANASISFDGMTNTLSISGDLLISGALNLLDSTAVVGTNFGTFSMTAVVPEPSTWALLGTGALLLGLAGHRRLRKLA